MKYRVSYSQAIDSLFLSVAAFLHDVSLVEEPQTNDPSTSKTRLTVEVSNAWTQETTTQSADGWIGSLRLLMLALASKDTAEQEVAWSWMESLDQMIVVLLRQKGKA